MQEKQRREHRLGAGGRQSRSPVGPHEASEVGPVSQLPDLL